jgi:hypothetical protein
LHAELEVLSHSADFIAHAVIRRWSLRPRTERLVEFLIESFLVVLVEFVHLPVLLLMVAKRMLIALLGWNLPVHLPVNYRHDKSHEKPAVQHPAPTTSVKIHSPIKMKIY